jgi:hypothetical protein
MSLLDAHEFGDPDAFAERFGRDTPSLEQIRALQVRVGVGGRRAGKAAAGTAQQYTWPASMPPHAALGPQLVPFVRAFACVRACRGRRRWRRCCCAA